MKLNSKELRKLDEAVGADAASSVSRAPLVLILENIYDTYNIGGLFRLADGLGVRHMYLCGETTPPPNNRIHKASCGTYKIVPWSYHATASEAIMAFRSLATEEGHTSSSVIAIEQSDRSRPYTEIHPSIPLALIVGNETFGVTPETLALCDETAEIPMWGINKSLNVIVSAGIVSYHYIHHLRS